MRSVACIIITIIYSCCFTWYIFELPDPKVPIEYLKAFYSAFNASILLFYFFDLKAGIESEWHRCFNALCFFCPIINFVFIILYWLNVLSDPFTIFLSSNGAIIVTGIFLLFSGTRHGTFNDN